MADRPRSNFLQSVVTLAGGTAGAQLILIASAPILSRLFDPSTFGQFALFNALLGILTVVAGLRYQLAIPLPEDESEGFHLLVLTLIAVVTNSALCTIVIVSFDFGLIFDYGTDFGFLLWFIPPAMLALSAWQALTIWAIRVGMLGAVAQSNLVQAVGIVVLQVVLFPIGAAALVYGRLLGVWASLIHLAWTVRGRTAKVNDLRLERIGTLARLHRNFPLISTWTGLANAMSSQLPVLLIASFFGVAAAGTYALTHRVLHAPMRVIGKAVGDVFYNEAAYANRAGELGTMIRVVHHNLTVFSFPVAALLFVVAPSAFTFVFGPEWAEAGEIARWMTPWLVIQFVTGPATRIFPVLDMHRSALIFQGSLLLAAIACLTLADLLGGDLVFAVQLLSVVNAGIYISRLWLCCRLVGLRFSQPLWTMLESLGLALVTISPLGAIEILVSVESAPAWAWPSCFLASCLLVSLNSAYRWSKRHRM